MSERLDQIEAIVAETAQIVRANTQAIQTNAEMSKANAEMSKANAEAIASLEDGLTRLFNTVDRHAGIHVRIRTFNRSVLPLLV